MNRIYRTLWSVATQSWQAVPEIAKTAGKKSKSSTGGVIASVALSFSLTGGAGAQSPPAANQLPTGASVSRGNVTITQTATAQAAAMTVTQTSQRAVVNWDTFNIGSKAGVNFVQPNTQAITLNRVNDSNPSQIFGRITSNGQVFLSNANGIYFAPGSSVDVGAITATTHGITDDNFMSGKYVFDRQGATGKVVNEGSITTGLSGYVALLAPEVQNAGVVVARAGTVAMASGETITLKIEGTGSLAGITTTPSAIATLIENKQAIQAPDGQIILSAVALNKLQAGIIKNSGNLEVNSLVSKGGKIYLEADDITLASTSKLEAKGASGGGTVLIGGDWQGGGDLRPATKITMAAGATIDASATDKGDGGKVVLWSDTHNVDSQTLVHGNIKAEAGPNGGDGGKIETSGHYLNVDDIQVSTSAHQGNTGEWLLDPYDITIASAGTTVAGTTWAAGTVTASGTQTYTSAASSTILGSAISTALASNNVTIKTGGTIGDGNGNGDITVDTAITKSGSTSTRSTLTLTAARNININQKIESTATGTYPQLNVVLTAGNDITLSNNSYINTNGGNFYIGAVPSVGSDAVNSSGQNLTINQGSYINSGKGLVNIRVGGSISLPDNSTQTNAYAISMLYDSTYPYPISNSSTTAITYNYTQKTTNISAGENITTANTSSSYADIYSANDVSLTAKNIGSVSNPLQITGNVDPYGLVAAPTTATGTFQGTSRVLTINNYVGSTYLNEVPNSGYANQAFNTINLNVGSQASSAHIINISGNPGGSTDPYAGTGHIMVSTDSNGTLIIPTNGINTVGVGTATTSSSSYVTTPAPAHYVGGQEPTVFPTSVGINAYKISLTDTSVTIYPNYYSVFLYSGSSSKYTVSMGSTGLGTNFTAYATTSITNASTNYISDITAYNLTLSGQVIGTSSNPINISKGTQLALTTLNGVNSSLYVNSVDSGFSNITISNNRIDSGSSSVASILWQNGDHINYTYGNGNSYYIASNGGTYSLTAGVPTFSNTTGIKLSGGFRSLTLNSNLIYASSLATPNGVGAGYVTFEPDAVVMGYSGSFTLNQNAANSDSNGNGITSSVIGGTAPNITGATIAINNNNSTSNYSTVNSTTVTTPIKTGISNLVFNPITYYTSGATNYTLTNNLTVNSYWGNIDVSQNKLPDATLTNSTARYFNNFTLGLSGPSTAGQTARMNFIGSTDVVNISETNGSIVLDNNNVSLSSSNSNFVFNPTARAVQVNSVSLGTGTYSINAGTGMIRLNGDILTNGGLISLTANNLILMKSVTIDSNADELTNTNHTGISGAININASKISANAEGYTLTLDSGSQTAASGIININYNNTFDNTAISGFGGKYLGGLSLKSTKAGVGGTDAGINFYSLTTNLKGTFRAEGTVSMPYGANINTNFDNGLTNAGDILFAGASLSTTPNYNFTFTAKSTLGNGGKVDLYSDTAHSPFSALNLTIDTRTTFAGGTAGDVLLPTTNLISNNSSSNNLSITAGQINLYGNINTQSYGTSTAHLSGNISLTGDIRLATDITMNTWTANYTLANNLYAGYITLGGTGVSSLSGNKSLTLNTSPNSSYTFASYFSTTGGMNTPFTYYAGAISLKGNSAGLGLNTVTANANVITNTYAGGAYGDITLDGVSSTGNQTYSGKNITLANNASSSTTGSEAITSYGNILLSSDLTAATTITLTSKASAANTVSGTGVLTTGTATGSGLKLIGNNTTYTLSNANGVSNLAAILSGSGSFTFKNASALTVGSVGGTSGISTSGVIDVRTLSGDLNIIQNITTTDASASAILLAAGDNNLANTSSGGDVKIAAGAALTMGTGGRGLIYTGSVANTTLNQQVAAGNFRYNSDTTHNGFTQSITPAATYAIYREKPIISITASDLTKAYDGNAFVGGNGYTHSALVNGDSDNTIGTVAYSGTSQNVVNASNTTYTITPSISAANALGYGYAYTSGTLTVIPAHLTVSADSLSKVYGEANPALTASITGFVHGETLATSGVSGSATLATTASTYTPVGNVAITPSLGTLTATNYDFTNFSTGHLTIQQRPITFTASASSKVYGETNPTLSYATESTSTGRGLVNSDTFTGSLSTSATQFSAVGTYAINSTLENSNYAVTYVSANLDVRPRPITLSANASSKVYGEANPALTYTAESASAGRGLVNNDTFTGSLNTSANQSSSVGSYAIASTLANSNYNISYVAANLDITPRPITLSANASSKVYGEANPALTYTAESASAGHGLVNNDTFTGSLNTSANQSSSVGSYAIASTLANSNYNISYVAANLDVTPRPITLSANASSKVYGEANPALTYATEANSANRGLVNNDSFTGGLSVSATQTSAVGQYAIASTLTNSNYDITFIPNHLAITPRPVTLTGVMNYNGTSSLDTSATSSTLTVTNALFNDRIDVSGTALLAGISAGPQAIANFNGLNLSNSNYTTQSATGSVNVIGTSSINVSPLKTAEVAALIGGQLSGLTGTQIGSFSASQLQVFSGNQIAALSASQLSGLSATQLGSLGSAQLQAITPAQVALLGSAQIAGLDATQLAVLSAPQLQALSPQQVSALSPAQLSELTPAQISVLTGNPLASLSASQLGALTPSQVSGVSTSQIARMAAAEINGLSAAQLQALTPIQISAIPASNIGALSTNQLANMSSTQLQTLSAVQLASLSPVQLTALLPTQISALTATQMSGLSQEQIQSITPSQIQSLGSTQLTALTPNQMAAMAGPQLQAFSSAQIKTLALPQLSTLSNAQIQALTENSASSLSFSQLASLSSLQISGVNAAQFSVLNPSEISTLSSMQLQALKPAQLAAVTPKILAELKPEQLQTISQAQLAALSPAQLSALSTLQLQVLTPAQISVMAAAQLSALSPIQISALTSNTNSALRYSQVASLSATQIQAIHPSQFAQMTAAELGSLNNTQLQALTPAQIDAIAPANFGAFSAEQIMAMSSTQVQSLSPEQLASFTPLQVASLSNAELAGFDNLQLAAIGIYPQLQAQVDPQPQPTNRFEAAIPVMTALPSQATAVAVPQNIADLSGLQVRALTPEQLNSLPQDQVASLKPAQLQALTTTQLSQLKLEQAENLTPSQLSVMSPRQIQSLPTTSTTDVSPHQGVLAITILHSAQANPTSAGIAFEQSADTISLKTAAAPPVAAPMTDKVVFADKLTTFMVSTPEGEMVEFQGSLVNNRMVIAATSTVAKRVARSEMNLVLAAAITSLGKENRVMLASLTGVVLDLR